MRKVQISIDQVLAEMRGTDGPKRPFQITFVRATGQRQGTVKVVTQALYGSPAQIVRERTAHGARSRALHMDKGTIPLTDLTADRLITPLISHIIGYEGQKVIH